MPQLEWIKYIKLYEQYSKQYGKICLLYQIGDFYEIYGVDNGTDKICNIREVCYAGELQIQKKKNTIDDPLKAGFKIQMIEKYSERFLKEGFKLVIFDQTLNAQGKIIRTFTRIDTPSLNFNDTDKPTNLTFIFKQKKIAALVTFNCTTQSLFYKEIINQDNLYIDDEIQHFRLAFPDAECFCNTDLHNSQLFTPEYGSLTKQNHIFNKCFEKDINETDLVINHLAKQTIAELLHYCFTINPSICIDLKLPKEWLTDTSTLLMKNAIDQLGVEQLLEAFDKPKTKMGRDLLRQTLLNPIFSIKKLKKRYGLLKLFVDSDHKVGNIKDTVKLIKKIELNQYSEKDILCLKQSIVCASEIDYSSNIKFTELLNIFENVTDDISDLFDMAEIKEKRTNILNKLKFLCKQYDCSFIQKTFDLKMTVERYKSFKLKDVPGTTYITKGTKYMCFKTDEHQKIKDELIQIDEEIKQFQIDQINKLKESLLKYKKEYYKINNLVAKIDMYQTMAKYCKKWKYTEPILVKDDHSWCKGKDVRHPISEKLTKEIYTPNDVDLEKGILIYGTNGGGKSVFMKSVGLCVLLAQCGFPVPAKSFTLSCFRKIMTRILGNDDMQNNLSSFQVEMIELAGIMNRIDRYSLVLGDELCKGTEITSSKKIMCASLKHLVKANSKFIFASHLFGILPQLKDIKDKFSVFHLRLKRISGKIVYDRKLYPGQGETFYGVEVAKSMGFPDWFLSDLDEEPNLKMSHYNKKKLVVNCEICGDVAIDTDHIIPQKDADSNGMIKHFHKNHLGNLQALCKKCHHNKTHL